MSQSLLYIWSMALTGSFIRCGRLSGRPSPTSLTTCRREPFTTVGMYLSFAATSHLINDHDRTYVLLLYIAHINSLSCWYQRRRSIGFSSQGVYLSLTFLAMLIWALVNVPTSSGMLNTHTDLSGSNLSWHGSVHVNSGIGYFFRDSRKHSTFTVRIDDAFQYGVANVYV